MNRHNPCMLATALNANSLLHAATNSRRVIAISPESSTAMVLRRCGLGGRDSPHWCGSFSSSRFRWALPSRLTTDFGALSGGSHRTRSPRPAKRDRDELDKLARRRRIVATSRGRLLTATLISLRSARYLTTPGAVRILWHFYLGSKRERSMRI